MPLNEDNACLVFTDTDCMHLVLIFFLKLQSSSLGFSINRECVRSSFLGWGFRKQMKDVMKRIFYLYWIKTPKYPMKRGLMWGGAFLKSQCLFRFFTLSLSP